MDITDFFISSPVSAIWSLVLGVSMTVVYDETGKFIFKRNELWLRGIYFFSGLLFTAWIIFMLSFCGFVDLLIFRILASVFVTLAGVLLIKKKEKPFSCRLIISASKKGTLTDRFFHYAALVAFILCVVISLAPPTDADSLDYHLGIPLEILKNGSLWFNKDNLHFRLLGFVEMINLFGLANGCLQLGAFIQIIALAWTFAVFLAEVKFAEKINLAVLCFSIPLFLSLIPSQKHQLTGVFCTSLCFYILSQHIRLLTVNTFILLICCIWFAAGLKYSFFISAAVLVSYAAIKAPRNFQKPRMAALVIFSFIVVLGPILSYKFIDFGDSLSPLFENIKQNPDPVVLYFHHWLKQYSDSSMPFPASLFVPGSLGAISTVLGWGGIILIAFFGFYRQHKPEVLTVGLLVVLTIFLGQKTSRFFLEPYFWVLPLFVKTYRKYRFGKYLVIGGQVQFLVLLPFIAFCFATLSGGIIGEKQREGVMRTSAAAYAETRWIKEELPADAVLATLDIRSRALLGRRVFPLEYLSYYSQLKNSHEKLILDSLLKKQYKVDYLVLSNSKANDSLKSRYAGDIVAGPKKFKTTSRNPFNRNEYELTIYRMK